MIAFKGYVYLAMVGGILALPHPLLADGEGEENACAPHYYD